MVTRRRVVLAMVYTLTSVTADGVEGGEQPQDNRHSMTQGEAAAVPGKPFVLPEQLGYGKVREKLLYAELMFSFKPAQRITQSNNHEAKRLLGESKLQVQKARELFDKGDLEAADHAVKESYRLMARAAGMVPGQHVREMERKRYPEMIAGLDHAIELHQANYDHYKKPEERAVYQFDHDLVNYYRVEAALLAEQEQFKQANQKLEQARRLVDNAIANMMDSQTVVYQVDVSTPQKEYQYELGRYHSYEELIPVAIEMKQPSKMQLMLVQRNVDKAQWMLEQAQQTADGGDYPRAIRMVMDAAKEIRKALKLMKVQTYE